MTLQPEYMSDKECKEETVIQFRKMPIAELRAELRHIETHERAFHQWAVEAIRQVAKERENE